jgi:hypothetical protein
MKDLLRPYAYTVGPLVFLPLYQSSNTDLVLDNLRGKLFALTNTIQIYFLHVNIKLNINSRTKKTIVASGKWKIKCLGVFKVMTFPHFWTRFCLNKNTKSCFKIMHHSHMSLCELHLEIENLMRTRIKGTISQDFSRPVFFIKQLLLILIGMPRNNFEFFWISWSYLYS